jgi:hypothetical protein
MKGIVFTEFNDMVEEKFSPELLDEIISECKLASGGAYTSVGTYEHTELVAMVGKLSEKTDIPADTLVYAFGEHLAVRFSELFPAFFTQTTNVFDFMKSLDQHIHVEVKKLYPDAALPKFNFDDSNPACLVMEYQSSRGFAVLAHGLMTGVIKHYGESIDITLERISGNHHVRFNLNKV